MLNIVKTLYGGGALCKLWMSLKSLARSCETILEDCLDTQFTEHVSESMDPNFSHLGGRGPYISLFDVYSIFGVCLLIGHYDTYECHGRSCVPLSAKSIFVRLHRSKCRASWSCPTPFSKLAIAFYLRKLCIGRNILIYRVERVKGFFSNTVQYEG